MKKCTEIREHKSTKSRKRDRRKLKLAAEQHKRGSRRPEKRVA